MTKCPLHKTRPKIICLCGSTRFREAFERATWDEARASRIVLSVGRHAHAEGYEPPPDEKTRLDDLHLRKIDLADEVLILNVGGYIGESTGNELAYALASGKPVRTLEPMDIDAWLAERDAAMRATARGPQRTDDA